MSDLTNVFTDIADAIRAKTETQITYKPTEMANAINNIETGGGALVYYADGVPINQWFNVPVTIVEGVTNTSNLFKGCYSFNQPVTIPASVTNTAYMFSDCRNFNQPVTIPNNVTNSARMFASCFNLNQSVTIPNSITNTAYMFGSCYDFNQPVTIPDNAVSTVYMFSSCYDFNQPVTIPASVTNASSMFSLCYNLNQLVTIPNSITDTSSMFSGCHNFNQPVTIPDNAVSTVYMFSDCYNLNQPVTIPASVTNASSMFSLCYNLNQPVTIPNNVANIAYMFSECHSLNQPALIPASATNIVMMFGNCASFGSNVYVFPTNLTRQKVAYMFNNCNNQLLKRIFTNNTYTFIGTTTTQSVTGKAITWTQDGANYYNTDFNIYIHNVANPYSVLNNADYSSGNGGVNLASINSPAIVFGSGVRNLNSAFSSTALNSNNTLIMFEEGVENLAGCFLRQTLFNQPLTIPSSAVNCLVLMSGCYSFNSPIIFRNGVKDIGSAISFCNHLASDIWIPESITNMQSLLYGTPYTSGNIHISHNIALGDTANYIYNSLVNEYIGISLDPSRILNDY